MFLESLCDNLEWKTEDVPLKSSHISLTELGKKQKYMNITVKWIPFPPDPFEKVSEISCPFNFSAFTQNYCIVSLEVKIQVKSHKSYDAS